ncbi:MAG: DNA repair protein RadC [Candidatus Brocadiaceae bacterium]|jgi:DNA repair protein RadC
MADASPEPAEKPYGSIYRALRGTSRAREQGQSDEDPARLIELCRRLGAFPKSWSDARAAPAVRKVVARMAEETGVSEETVCADLVEFCSEESPRGPCGTTPRCTQCPVREHCEYPERLLTIKELPESERPRERLLDVGSEKLSDRELLALIIGGGSPKATALDLAGRLLHEFGNFRAMAQCTPGELARVHGIGPAKAARIKAALTIARRYASRKLPSGTPITGSERVFTYMSEKLAGLKREHFFTLMLDTKNHLIREERIAVGSLNESVVHPREVFRGAISESAAKVIFVHNHPSGDPEPSPQDRRLTARLCEAGNLVGISVLDHLIVGSTDYYSFAEHGQLGPNGN